MHRRVVVLSFCVAALVGAAGAARADLVSDWNEELLDAIRTDRTAPPRAARAMACVHVALFEAYNSVLGGFTPYHVTDDAPAGASAEAAATQAAHRALSAMFPNQAARFDEQLAESLLAIPDGPAKTAGVAWGLEVADEILALRAADHSTDTVAYESADGANWWIPTPPGFAPPALPQWPNVTPWAMSSGAQFRGGPPPGLGTPEYTAAFAEVRRLGRQQSHQRTADQSEIALFWADGPGTATPPGHWLVIAQHIAEDEGLSPLDKSRLLALLSITVADAAIVSWDFKYAYNHWRPVTAIQHADTDGNPDTEADPGWQSFIATPPFPAYTSGHSTFSGSSARILDLFFGGDDFAFSDGSDGLPGVTRSFTSFSQAAEEAGQSRIYGGIHWQYDNQIGLASGRALAEHVFFTQLSPLGAVGPCGGTDSLCLGDNRFKVQAQFATATGSGSAHPVDDTAASGRFWFFDEDNTELVVKALDGCAFNGKFWVFASGLTDVQVLITVTDTQTGRTRRYFNPRGKALQPVQDTAAFPCE